MLVWHEAQCPFIFQTLKKRVKQIWGNRKNTLKLKNSKCSCISWSVWFIDPLFCDSYMVLFCVQNVPGQTGQSQKTAPAAERWYTFWVQSKTEKTWCCLQRKVSYLVCKRYLRLNPVIAVPPLDMVYYHILPPLTFRYIYNISSSAETVITELFKIIWTFVTKFKCVIIT